MATSVSKIAENICKDGSVKPTIDFGENKKILKNLKINLSRWMLNKVSAWMVRMAKRAAYTG